MKLSLKFVENFGRQLDTIVEPDKHLKINTALKTAAYELAEEDMFVIEKMRAFSNTGKTLLQYDDKTVPQPHQSVNDPLIHKRMLEAYLDKRFMYHAIMGNFNNCLSNELEERRIQCTQAVSQQLEKSRKMQTHDAAYYEAEFALRSLIAEQKAFLREQPLYYHDDKQTRQIMLQKDTATRRHPDGQKPA